jgi:hypothetical protein
VNSRVGLRSGFGSGPCRWRLVVVRDSSNLWVPPKIVETSIFVCNFVAKRIFRQI